MDLLVVQGTFRSLLQHHSSKVSVIQRSAFFTVQLSQPYVIAGKTIAVTVWTFVGRVMSLLFNTLSRFVIAFLPRSNRLLISWQQSPSSVILEPKKRKFLTTSTFPPSVCYALELRADRKQHFEDVDISLDVQENPKVELVVRLFSHKADRKSVV